ncbi:MAG TPA: hypothetical protein VFV98_01115 [Vicinamibacterales bacterium]|nr:hypothetical protein [Vicinamibacterales bacterium]
MIRIVKAAAVAAIVGTTAAIVFADGPQMQAQKGKPSPPPTITAAATWDNSTGDRITIDNPTLPVSGTLQDSGGAAQFLFSLPASGKNKRYLNFTYPLAAFVPTPCDPSQFLTSPSGSTGVNVYGAWVAIRSLTSLQIGEARAVVAHFGASAGQFLWMGETNVVHDCTNFVAAYRVDQRTWRVSTALDRLSVPVDGDYHGVVGGKIYEGGCRTQTGCQTPLLMTPGGLVVLQPTSGFDRHYNMAWGATIYCETCPPPPVCASWPIPGQPCQFAIN